MNHRIDKKNKKIGISIGILAYNESERIGPMLRSLFKQNFLVLSTSNNLIEIIVVANGCTDNTAAIAKSTLEELATQSKQENISWRVCEVGEKGKSNAWNIFVHELSSQKADYLFLMDADIVLHDRDTLHSMVKVLETRPEVWIAVDKPIKDVSLKKDRNLIDKLSILVSGLSGNHAVEGGPAWLCGQLYCARSEILRRIWLPIGSPTQDALLYTMIVTDCYKSPARADRIVLAGAASHIFEAYTNITRLFRHEKLLIIGNTVNEIIYKELIPNSDAFQDAGLLFGQKNRQDPKWLNKYIQDMAAKKWWLVPRFIFIRRFKSLMNKPLRQVVLLFPLALVAFMIDFGLAFQANRQLHKRL